MLYLVSLNLGYLMVMSLGFVDHKILCPILRDAPSEYLNFLVDFLGKNPQDVIIPMYNDSAELLSQK